MNNKHTIVFIAVIFVSAVFLPSCRMKTLDNYDRAALLKNLADSVIVRSYSDFAAAASDLESASVAFSETPDVNTLTSLRSAWKTCLAKWMHCEMFTFGYVNSNFIIGQIGATPADFQEIENEIQGTNTIDEAYIAATGTRHKGLAAVEYLIYEDSVFQKNVLESFTSSPSSARRKQYLRALCQNMKTKINATLADWNGNASYKDFVSHTEFGVTGSLNLLANDLVGHMETVRKTKFGIASGNANNGTNPGPSWEFSLSSQSLENIRENILAWKEIFTGKNGPGFDDYLDYVGAQSNGKPLSSEILNEFDILLDKAKRITLPLPAALIQQRTEVFALHSELNRLIVLTKNDLPAKLGLVVTYNDFDGD